MSTYVQKLKLIVDDLTYSEELLAEYIEKNITTIGKTTSSELSKLAGVSQSTIIRFSQKLGYQTYKKMLRDLGSVDSLNEEDIEPKDSTSTTLDKLKKEYDEAISVTFDINPLDKIEKACDFIGKARRIIVIGFSEKNVIFAQYFAYRLSFAGYDAISLDKSTTSYSHINMMNKNDVLILISESGETQQMLNYASIAKKKNVKVISITKKNQNTLADISDLDLRVINFGKRGFMKVSMVRISMLVLFDAIYMNLVKENYEEKELFYEKIKMQTKLNYKEK